MVSFRKVVEKAAVVGLVVENVQVARWIFYLAAVVLQPCWQKNRLIPNLG